MRSTSLFQVRSMMPSGRGMACRQKAIFLISFGMYQLLRLPAG